MAPFIRIHNAWYTLPDVFRMKCYEVTYGMAKEIGIAKQYLDVRAKSDKLKLK